jgi:hypothetical protein
MSTIDGFRLAGKVGGVAVGTHLNADWRRIVSVDLVGTALLAEARRPLATAGTATVRFASSKEITNRRASRRDSDEWTGSTWGDPS